MKKIGLIGGVSWESSLEYYRIINEEVMKRLGGFNSGEIIMYSLNFNEIEFLVHKMDFESISKILLDAAKRLEKAGAEVILICSNTLHQTYDLVLSNISVPMIHIADSTGREIQKKHIKKIGLLGTRYTMESDFYKNRLLDKFGVEAIIPKKEEMDKIDKIIFNELCVGKVMDSSKNELIKIIDNLIEKGAEGIILGCTELPLIIFQKNVKVKLYDTTRIHAESAVDYSLS